MDDIENDEEVRNVYIELLGLCEHCRSPVFMGDILMSEKSGDWRCPLCCRIIGKESFGFSPNHGMKTRWVGSNQQWVVTKPKEDFAVGNFYVYIRPIEKSDC